MAALGSEDTLGYAGELLRKRWGDGEANQALPSAF